jgi:hypothetical protein
MADTGWPLIPRELLPAPVPPAQLTARRSIVRADLGRQLSIFGAETTEPSPADLAGLLAGPGRLDRMGGTARVSVRVDAAWRVHVLVAELVRRGLVVSWVPVAEDDGEDGGARELSREPFETAEAPDPTAEPQDPIDEPQDPTEETQDQNPEAIVRNDVVHQDPGAAQQPDPVPATGPTFEVRTAYSSRLNGLARSWPTAAAQLFLSGPRLRLWVAAAGEPRPGGYALGLDPDRAESENFPEIIDSALVRAGLAGRVSDDGRYWLILGRKRLRRLAELVGERPQAAPGSVWPGGATA